MGVRTITAFLIKTCMFSMILPSFHSLSTLSFEEKTKTVHTTGAAPETETANCFMESDGHKSCGSNETLKLVFQSETTITNIKANNLSIIHSSLIENILTIDINVKSVFSSLTASFISNETEGSIVRDNSLSPEEQSSHEETATYYLYLKNGFTYTSSVSIDTAIMEAGDDPEIIHSSLAIEPGNPITPTPVEFNGYRGTILWKDSEGHTYPLEGAKISIDYYTYNPHIMDTKVVYTDQNGYFNTSGLILGSGIDRTFKLTLANRGIEVYRCDNSKDNMTVGFENRKSEYTLSLSNRIHDLANGIPLVIQTVSDGMVNDFGAATNIFECLYYYHKYANLLPHLDNIPKCSALYPCAKDYSGSIFYDLSVAYYIGSTKMIIIPAGKPNDEGLTAFQSWDLLGHEYGHHIGNCFHVCQCVGAYSHSYRYDDIDKLAGHNLPTQDNVNLGLSLSWAESWPTYWAEVAQATFPEAIRSNYGKGYVSDKVYEAYNFRKKNYYHIDDSEPFGNITSPTLGGEACEAAIQRFLYEVNRAMGGYADDTTPSTDHLWNLIYDCGTNYYANSDDNNMKFSDFYNYLYSLTQDTGSYGLLSINVLSEIAANVWIAPIQVKCEWKGCDVNVSWETGGRSQGMAASCKASLTFFDEDGIQVGSVPLGYVADEKEYFWEHVRFSAIITQSMLYTTSTSTMSVGLSFSPHYCFRNNEENEEEPIGSEPADSHTGPYTRIIWEGQTSQLNLASLSVITLE